MPNLNDINSKKSLETLLKAFYSKALTDNLLSEKFKNIDLNEHLPVIVNFWESILLGGKNYQGNPFSKHIHMNLEKHHFDRWVLLFTETVNEKFSGPTANEAINRAQLIAQLFQSKLERLM